MKLLPALAVTLLWGAGLSAAVPEDPRFLMIQARALQRRGGGDNPEGAAALYRKVIALMPGSAQAQLRLSEAIMETGDLQACVPPAIKATELDPASGEAWAHLGLLYYLQSRSSDAARGPGAEALRKAVRLLPGDAELWTRCAELEEGLKDEEGALKSWLSVGRLHPGAQYRGRVLADFAWERTLELSVKLKRYETRREAVLALCEEPGPDQRRLRYLEDLARDQVELGFLGHAEESFELLARNLPMEPAIWENIAIIQLRTNRFETALATLGKAEAMHPTPRLSFNLGLCLMKLGRLPEAETRWKALLPIMGDNPDDASLKAAVKVLYATSLLLQGRPQEMLELSAPWREASTNAELVSLRAQALIQTQDWRAARKALKDGMARFPDSEVFQSAREIPPGTFEEGWFFTHKSRQALSQLNLESMAGLWAEFHDWEHCLLLVREARKAAPVKDIELLLLESNALDSLGRTDEAMTVLREGQKLNPNHPTLQNNLGFLLLEKGGNLPEATRLIETSIAQEPKNSSTMDSWGWALFKNGRFKESETVLRKAATLSPFSPEVHRHLGEALLKLNRLHDALEEWDRALAFAFPDRKALEAEAQELRTRLAKTQQGKEQPPAEEPAEAGDEAEEEAE